MTKSGATKADPKRHRRNLSLTQTSLNSIANIRQGTDAISDTEVIRRALKLYEAVVNSQGDGRNAELLIRTPGQPEKPLLLL